MVVEGRATDADRRVVLADFFSGCGGTSLGFTKAGIEPVFAIDWDPDSIASYQLNFPETTAINCDIRDLTISDVRDVLKSVGEAILLFAGCAPCQPFAGHQRRSTASDSRTLLLLEFLRFIKAFNPELIFMENVAGMQRLPDLGSPFDEFVCEVSKTHSVTYGTVLSADYGVPQMRRRLVLIASRLGSVDLPRPTHGNLMDVPYSTVREWIHGLPPLNAGDKHSVISSHSAYALSPLNLERIQATPEGGDRRDWPRRLWPDCHRGGFTGHTDVYGRLNWDKPAPALTTRCISYSNGRFGHPSQDRALSVREAACLQTFPRSFKLAGSLTSQAKQIGNAVPVLLAEHFGRHLIQHIEHMEGIR